MSELKEGANRDELYAHLEWLEVILGDCAKLLANWKVLTPYQSAASPDAVLAIVRVQEDLREQVRMIHNTLGEEQLPF